MPLKTVGNIRRKFAIKGHEWKVIYVHNLSCPEDGPLRGLCDPDNRTISIERQLSPELKWRTFTHELVHAVEFELHIQLPDGISEVLADGIDDVFNTLFDFTWKGSRRTRKDRKNV